MFRKILKKAGEIDFDIHFFREKEGKEPLRKKIFHCASLILIGVSALFLGFKQGYVSSKEKSINPEVKVQVEDVAVKMDKCLPEILDMNYSGPEISVPFRDFLSAYSNAVGVNENRGFLRFFKEKRQAIYDAEHSSLAFYPQHNSLDIDGEIDLMKAVTEHYLFRKLGARAKPETQEEKAKSAFMHGLAYHTVFAILPINNPFIVQSKKELEERLRKYGESLDSFAGREALGYFYVDKIIDRLGKEGFKSFNDIARIMLEIPPSYQDLTNYEDYTKKLEIADWARKNWGK